MLDLELDIQYEEPFGGVISEDLLRRAVEKTLEAARVSGGVEVGLVIAGDETVHALNKQYRAKDNTTDVLSFALEEQSGDEGFILPPDGVKRLGEVIISYPQAGRQAGEQEHSIEHEVTFLVIHGVLHLLGYDHELPADRRKMKAREKKALAAVETSL